MTRRGRNVRRRRDPPILLRSRLLNRFFSSMMENSLPKSRSVQMWIHYRKRKRSAFLFLSVFLLSYHYHAIKANIFSLFWIFLCFHFQYKFLLYRKMDGLKEKISRTRLQQKLEFFACFNSCANKFLTFFILRKIWKQLPLWQFTLPINACVVKSSGR